MYSFKKFCEKNINLNLQFRALKRTVDLTRRLKITGVRIIYC